MWNEAPCPTCKTTSKWSEYFNYFYCETCETGFHAPERRVHSRWEDQKILAGAIEYLVKITDAQQKTIEALESRIARLEPPASINMRR